MSNLEREDDEFDITRYLADSTRPINSTQPSGFDFLREPGPPLRRTQRVQPQSLKYPYTLVDMNKIQQIPLNNSVVNLTHNDVGDDIIMGDEEINILNYLNEDINNIAFYFLNHYYVSNKDTIKQNILNLENNVIKNLSAIKLGCKQVQTTIIPRVENLYIDKPCLSMRNLGIMSGLCYLGEIKTLLNDPGIRCVEISDNIEEVYNSTASVSMLISNPNAVGASHCQEGQGENVRKLKIINLPSANKKRRLDDNDEYEDEIVKKQKIGGKYKTRKNKIRKNKTRKYKSKKNKNYKTRKYKTRKYK